MATLLALGTVGLLVGLPVALVCTVPLLEWLMRRK